MTKNDENATYCVERSSVYRKAARPGRKFTVSQTFLVFAQFAHSCVPLNSAHCYCLNTLVDSVRICTPQLCVRVHESAEQISLSDCVTHTRTQSNSVVVRRKQREFLCSRLRDEMHAHFYICNTQRIKRSHS